MFQFQAFTTILGLITAQVTRDVEKSEARRLTSNEAGSDTAAFAVLASIFLFITCAYLLNTYCGGQGNDSSAQESEKEIVVELGNKWERKAELGTGLLKFDEENTFDKHVRDISYTIRKTANNANTNEKNESPPESGVYKGPESLVIELRFKSVPNGSGFEVQGIGQDSVHDISITSGFLSKIGEMYWVESRIKHSEILPATANSSAIIESRTCIRGRYNFATQEFRGWFETDKGVSGRCVLFSSQDSSWLLNGLKKRNSRRQMLAEKNSQEHRRRSSAFTIITSNKSGNETNVPLSFPTSNESNIAECTSSIV